MKKICWIGAVTLMFSFAAFSQTESETDRHLLQHQACSNPDKWTQVEDDSRNKLPDTYTCEKKYTCIIADAQAEKSGKNVAEKNEPSEKQLLHLDKKIQLDKLEITLIKNKDEKTEKQSFTCSKKSDLDDTDPTICSTASPMETCAYHYGLSFGKIYSEG